MGPGASCRFWLLLRVSEKPAQGWNEALRLGWSYGSHGIEVAGGGVGGRWARDNPGMMMRAGLLGEPCVKWLHSRLPLTKNREHSLDWLDVGHMKASLMAQAVKKPPARQKPQET